MAKLERKNVKIFSSTPNNATQVTSFLTAMDETPNPSSDPDVIQNANYTKGWLAKGDEDLPQAEDLNGVIYTESYKIAYLYQQGIAEWIVTQKYFENSFCQVAGVLYQSLTDNNIGNDPTTDDGTNWKIIALEPYVGQNIGTAEGVYAGKTINNELQFKSIAVSGNGNISASDDTITIAIGGGGTGDVYWGAIAGDIEDQSDLQQALNQKQGIIGYTPEDVANKVTTIRTDTIATDTAYPTELATRTAIESAITTANTYTDNALLNLSSDAFVLYANSWTDIDTGTLTTTAPTGTGTRHTLHYISQNNYENIANFTYTTTQETRLNNTFTYDVLLPIRSATISGWGFKFLLTITHKDVNYGNPTTILNETKNLKTINGELNFEFKQDLLNINEIVYPTGSTINFSIQAISIPESGESTPYNFDLLVYDQNNPIVISRNKGINKNLVTAFNTQALGRKENQEYFNAYILNLIREKQYKINGFDFVYNSTTPYEASIIPVDRTISTNIGSNTLPITNIYTRTITNAPSTNNIIDININGFRFLKIDDSNNKILRIFESETGFTSQIIVDEVSGNTSVKSDLIVSQTGNTGSIGTNTNAFPTGYINNLSVATIKNKYTEIDSIEFLNNTTTGHYINYNAGTKSNNYGTHVFKSGGGVKFAIFENMVKSYVNLNPENSQNLGESNRRWNTVYAVTVNQSSDIRLKENIKDYEESAIEKIEKLKPVTFNFKEDTNKTKKLGLIAQELREEEPLCVLGEETEDEYLGIDSYALTVFCLKAIKELNEKVKTLEARIKELEK